ncbi:glycosyltransferase family 2 protein [Pontibacter brevis]
MIDISVIILNYNTFQLTCECIASVYAQTHGISYEIIVVDNGSTECDPKLIKEAFPDIKLVGNTTNVGFAKGNNIGLQYASGKTILLLNSDTKLLNNALLLAFKRLQEDPRAAAITGKVTYPHGAPQHVAQNFPSILLLLSEIFRLYKFIPKKKWGEIYAAHYFDYEQELYPDWIWATFFLIRRNAIDLFPGGKFPEDFFMYVEDKLWCYYLKKRGYRFIYSPLPHVVHYVAASTKDAKDFNKNITHVLVNEFLFLKKTKSVIYAQIYFALQAFYYRTSRYSLAPQLACIYWSIAKKTPQQELPYFAEI